MTITCRLRFTDKFDVFYEMDKSKNLIDDSVSVYAIKDDCYVSKTQFYVATINGKKRITPIYNGDFDYFYLIAERYAEFHTEEKV